MAALALSTLRARIAASLSSQLGPSGWTESRQVASRFGHDTNQLMSRSFAVGVNQTTFGAGPDRQRRSEGTRVASSIMVRFAWRMKADSIVASYDDGLDQELAVVKAIMATARTDLHLELESIPSRSVSGNWFLGDIRLRAVHRYPLE